MRGKHLIFVSFLVVISACTKPIPIPELPQGPNPAGAIILSDTLSAADIRTLFAVLNQKGALNFLAPLFNGASDAELSWLAQWLEKYLYRPSGSDSDLAKFLLQATASQRFSKLLSLIQWWKTQPEFNTEREGLFAFLNHPEAPLLIEHDIELLDPDWIGIVRELRKSSDARFTPLAATALSSQLAKPPQDVTGKEIVGDLVSVLGTPETQKSMSDLICVMDSHYAGNSFLRGISLMSDKYQSLAPQGFQLAIRQMLLTQLKAGESAPGIRNQLDLSLFFAASANQSTQGLFTALQTQLRERKNLTPAVVQQLQPFVANAISGLMREKLIEAFSTAPQDFWKTVSSAGPSDSFKQIYSEVLAVLTSFVALKSDTVENFSNNFPIYLNAIAITKWIEAQVSTDATAFTSGWNRAIKPVGLTVPFAEKSEQGVLTFPQETLMKGLGLDNFAKAFADKVSKSTQAPENINVTFALSEDSVPLRQSLKEAVQQSLTARPLGDPTPVVESAFYFLTHPSPGNPISLENFESDNLMDSFNRWVGFLPLAQLRQVKRLVFDDLGLAGLGPEDRKGILGWLPGDSDIDQRRRVMVNNLLISAKALVALDQPVATGVPSVLEVYQAVANYAGSDVTWLSQVLSVISKTALVREAPSPIDGKLAPRFPGVYKGIQSPVIARWMDRFSLVRSEDRPLIFRPFARAFDTLKGQTKSGVTIHSDVFLDIAASQRQGMEAWADRILQAWFKEPSPTDTEWDVQWIPYSALYAMVENHDHQKILTFFKGHLSRKQATDLISQLRQMSSNGELSRIFDLMKLMQDDQNRMKALGAALGEWQKSGELRAFLDAILLTLSND